MSVSEILAMKGSDVTTVDIDTSIIDVASTLAKRKIGAVVVLDDAGKVCGIASERDLVRLIAQQGADSLSEPVSTCMTQTVVSCRRADTIDTVMEKMTQGRFRHLPVIEDQRLQGIVSIGDVVKRKIEMAERDTEELKRYIAG